MKSDLIKLYVAKDGSKRYTISGAVQKVIFYLKLMVFMQGCRNKVFRRIFPLLMLCAINRSTLNGVTGQPVKTVFRTPKLWDGKALRPGKFLALIKRPLERKTTVIELQWHC